MRAHLVIAGLALATGCSNTEALGTAGSCFAAATDDPENPVFDRSEQRRGIRVVAPEEATTPPADFERCARGMPVSAEFVDENDQHFWLAVEAHHADTEIIPREIFGVVDGADLTLRQTRGWNISDTVFLSRGGQPILALQSRASLDGDHGALVVEDNGGDALPAVQQCGTMTTHALKVTDDEDSRVVANGQSAELIVGGVEFLATNIYSVEYGSSHCTDGPFPENQVTWVAVDSSL